MYFRNLFLSLFLVFAVGFAFVQAESKEPRGPKITSKVSILDFHLKIFWSPDLTGSLSNTWL